MLCGPMVGEEFGGVKGFVTLRAIWFVLVIVCGTVWKSRFGLARAAFVLGYTGQCFKKAFFEIEEELFKIHAGSFRFEADVSD